MGEIKEMIAKAKAAQAVFETFSQEKIDEIAVAVCKAVYDNAEMLSREAIDETRLGSYENKVAKHKNVIMGTARFLGDKRQRSVGLLYVEKDWGVETRVYAKPVGVVASITPSTGPTTTACSNAAHALKSGNACIVGPHPSAEKVSVHCVKLMQEAVEKSGGPENLIQCVEDSTIAKSGELMASCDVVIATGGAGLVKAAYSSGSPCFGVGPGNVQAIISEDYQDLSGAVASIIGNRAYDNGMLCTGEQTVFIPRSKEQEIVELFKAKQCYVIEDERFLQKLREEVFTPAGSFVARFAGLFAPVAAEMLGYEIPKDTKALAAKINKCGTEELLCKEILFPIVRLYVYDDFKDAVLLARKNLLEVMGAGHTACIWTNDEKCVDLAGKGLPVGRVLINQSGAASAGNGSQNGLEPTMSLGCGSWGGNTVSENVTYRHLRNISRVAFTDPGIPPYKYEDVFGRCKV